MARFTTHRPVAERDAAAEDRLLDLGMLVIRFRFRRGTEGWEQTVRKHPGVFGVGRAGRYGRERARGRFPPGSLVKARGRDWVVLPDARPWPAGGTPAERRPRARYWALPQMRSSEATLPEPDHRTRARSGTTSPPGCSEPALRVGFTASAGPFRSLGSIAVEPRQYQLVPLLLALRMPVVRLLIADDVGIGKTIEAGLIAKEMLEQGETKRLAVLCSPALAEQWRDELAEKFAIDAELVLPSTIKALQRPLRADESRVRALPVHGGLDRLHQVGAPARAVPARLPGAGHRRRGAHLRRRPASAAGTGSSRYDMLRAVAEDRDRHLILVTATPHSGSESAFRDLIGLLDPGLAHLDLDQPQGRETARPALRAAPPPGHPQLPRRGDPVPARPADP